MAENRKRVLALDLTTGAPAVLLERILDLARRRVSAYVCAANVHMAVTASRDPVFARQVNGADLVLADGMPLVQALALLYGCRQERMAGMDLLPRLLAEAERRQLAVYFYGGTEEVLAAMTSHARRDHPQLHIAGACAPPFRPLSPAEDEDFAGRIAASGAHLVLVALGCPRQEAWMAQHKGRIAAVMIGLGAAFPVYSGLMRRAPGWMQRLSLEWLYRLGQEPRRLAGRYLVTNTLFLWLLGRQFLARPSRSRSPA
jgi:N-acetylglucosaminyldiphosphoundecaprenol N-acetyl-beta-D-mannosaminyltransferase